MDRTDIPKMYRPDQDTVPMLTKAWEEYGHMVAKFDDLVAVRVFGFVALCVFDTGNNCYDMADLTWTGISWEMNNDSCGQIQLTDIAKMRSPIMSDRWYIEDHPTLGSL